MTSLSLAGDIMNWLAAGVVFPLMFLPLASLIQSRQRKNNLLDLSSSPVNWAAIVLLVAFLAVSFATLTPVLSIRPSVRQIVIFPTFVAAITMILAFGGGAKPVIARLAPLFEKIVSVAARAVMWLLLIMALIQFGIVVLRYVFGINYIFMQESITYMHASVLLLAAGYALLTDDHVRVDIFYGSASPKRKALIDFIGTYLFLFPVCLLLLWTASPYVANSWASGESSAEASGIAGVFILKSFIPAFALLLAMAGFNIAANAGDRLQERS